jgi:hypothetical protein
MAELKPETPKPVRWYAAITLFALTSWVLFVSCSSHGSSAGPGPFLLPTRTPTVTVTPTPAIYWHNGAVGRLTTIPDGASVPVTVYSYAYLHLLVNDNPVSTAVVYLTGTNLSAPLAMPYSGLAHYYPSGLDYAAYSVNSGFSYATNETYTLTCEAMGVTTRATQTAPGDITASWDADGAVTYISWAVDGDNDRMTIFDESWNPVTIFSSDLDPPVTLDPSTLCPAPGLYILNFYASNYTQAVTNSVSNSTYSVEDNFRKYFIKP